MQLINSRAVGTGELRIMESNNNHDKTPEKPQGVINYGIEYSHLDHGYEDYLVGDRAGLEHLRDKINEVLENGTEAHLDNGAIHTDLLGVAMSDYRPSDTEELGKLGSIACSSVFILLLVIFLLGLMSLINILF